ncbi:MAG TPA: S8 family serine peptidase, partial [Gaiellaceae bacterium]|nr:S8 family serine peptidase [Gaiellaceae bacterium]
PGRMLYAPASDPLAITVGASDIAGTVDRSDDGAAPWTSYGATAEGFAKPEVGAPGRWMIGPLARRSVFAGEFADRIVSPGFFWLSGTSFAAPVVAGVAQQLLARHPDWTPDQVKGALMVTATTPPAAPPNALGVGEIDGIAAAAVASPPNPNEGLDALLTADGAGRPVIDWEAWKAAVSADPGWTTASWTDTSWTNTPWTDMSWTNMSWTDMSWTDMSWTDMSWTDMSWTDASWTDMSWTDTARTP